MADQHLRSLAHPCCEPLFAPIGSHRVGLEDVDPKPGLFENRSQSWADVPPLGVGDVDQQPPPTCPLAERQFDQ